MQVEVAGGHAACHPSPESGTSCVHMAALGLPLRNDPFYPWSTTAGDYSRPLQLLARSLEFADPLTGERSFESGQTLVCLEDIGSRPVIPDRGHQSGLR